MGILNVTPDSFAERVAPRSIARAAVDAALRMEADGADLIDVGGESTRPGAEPVSADEELARVLPVIAALAGRLRVPISIDTYKGRGRARGGRRGRRDRQRHQRPAIRPGAGARRRRQPAPRSC